MNKITRKNKCFIKNIVSRDYIPIQYVSQNDNHIFFTIDTEQSSFFSKNDNVQFLLKGANNSKVYNTSILDIDFLDTKDKIILILQKNLERRKFKRKITNVLCSVIKEDEAFYGNVQDISKQGFKVNLDINLQLNAKIMINVFLSDEYTINCGCRVMYKIFNKDSNDNKYKYTYGLEIQSISKEDTLYIDKAFNFS